MAASFSDRHKNTDKSVSAQTLYHYQFTTRMHDIDAAGVMFFARYFYYAHDAYEAFLNHHALSIQHILKSTYLLPISHTEADFKAPVFLNELITIEILCSDIKANEFTLKYRFIDKNKKLRTAALTRHVCLNHESGKRDILPERMIKILSGEGSVESFGDSQMGEAN